MTWQRVKIKIPEGYKPDEREAIGNEIVQYIIKRTKSGKDKRNNSFPGYSDQYVKSLDFKIAGKSKSNVNLTLSGDMLTSLDVLNHKKGEITVGFDRGDKENNDKATGHITGKYGNSRKTKKRDFLGITQKDLKSEILKDYDLSDDDERRRRVDEFMASRAEV